MGSELAPHYIEWRYDKAEKPARNVFELGLKTFLNQPAYVIQYADFLIGANDVVGAEEEEVQAQPQLESTNQLSKSLICEKDHTVAFNLNFVFLFIACAFYNFL